MISWSTVLRHHRQLGIRRGYLLWDTRWFDLPDTRSEEWHPPSLSAIAAIALKVIR